MNHSNLEVSSQDLLEAVSMNSSTNSSASNAVVYQMVEKTKNPKTQSKVIISLNNGSKVSDLTLALAKRLDLDCEGKIIIYHLGNLLRPKQQLPVCKTLYFSLK